ncbi:thioesterase domain-containing protein [Streptomyces sp. NPDC017520]|uniref:thioesterase domain-containing protein n=1 Tax=Streptomyces sp. NPDC017520 TaxID=3364998 RepID=UPI00379125B7
MVLTATEIGKSRMYRHRDHYEFCLAILWERILNIQDVSIYDGFFELGGAEESAEAMLAGLTDEFGVEVPAGLFAAEPTIEATAALVREGRIARGAAQRPTWVPGADPAALPLVLLPTVEGEITFLYRILCSSEIGRPMLGLRSQGLDLEDQPLTTVDAIVDRYIADLDAAGVGEPYLISGVSSSAVIAFAMAQRLEQSGKRVAYLGLFEPPPVHGFQYDVQDLVDFYLADVCSMADIEYSRERREICIRRLKELGEFPSDYSTELVMRMAEVNALNYRAADVYQPRGRFGGHAVFYESREANCGTEPVGKLADATAAGRTYEQFWLRHLLPQTLVRRQNCAHRGLHNSRETRVFIREDIENGIRELRAF